MNACPPEYRHLTPAAECAIRSVRLNTAERPGGKPPTFNTAGGAWSKFTTAERRAQILAALANGPMLNIEVAKAINTAHTNTHGIMERMEADGLVSSSKHGSVRMWRKV